MDIPEAWSQAAAAVAADPALRTIYVVGETSSGKTTLCRFLSSRLSSSFPTASIDCDPGQSGIGPPASVGLRLGGVTCLRFVGATSPESAPLATAVAVRRLADRARELGAAKILLDSSGFVSGPAAHEFQVSLIDLLLPDALLCLQKGVSAARIAAAFRHGPRPRLFPLPVSPEAVERTPAQRRAYRRERFAEYLRAAEEREISLRGLALCGRIPNLRDPDRCRGLLVALCDTERFALAIGLLRSFDAARALARLFAPPCDLKRVASLQFGSLYVDESGEEIRSL